MSTTAAAVHSLIFSLQPKKKNVITSKSGTDTSKQTNKQCQDICQNISAIVSKKKNSTEKGKNE